jgi:hypothetical protein
MDDGRLEHLSRQLAEVTTRRVRVRGLVAAGLTAVLLRVDRSEAWSAKKGTKAKKVKTPCKAVTKPCTAAAQCCKPLICGGAEDECCAPITAACASNEHCCGGAVCQTNNAGEPRCCSPDGFPCTLVRECCSGLCFGGTCRTPIPDPTCLEHGEVCEDADECCDALICSNVINECCAPTNGLCLSNRECCRGVCRTNDDGEPTCCSSEGMPCTLPRECCSLRCLPNHTCAPSEPGCGDGGEECENSDQCCGSLVCGSNADFDRVCCLPSGAECDNNDDCCQSLNVPAACRSFSDGVRRCCGLSGAVCSIVGDLNYICCPGKGCGGFGCEVTTCE